uniref:Uncharacterized protein n=1 Tax=Lygus hesperus TaxID=30085 RepID=A0A146MDX9_LYGHE
MAAMSAGYVPVDDATVRQTKLVPIRNFLQTSIGKRNRAARRRRRLLGYGVGRVPRRCENSGRKNHITRSVAATAPHGGGCESDEREEGNICCEENVSDAAEQTVRNDEVEDAKTAILMRF